MKMAKSLLSVLLLLSLIFSLIACVAPGGNKMDAEAVKARLDTVYDNLEALDYGKFSLKYEEDSNIKWEIIELEYDSEGFFHSKKYLDERVVENGKEAKEFTYETYMWIDGTTLTRTYYYKEIGFNNNIPDKRYWVSTFSSYEEAIEEFEYYLQEDFRNSINFLEQHPIDYVLDLNYDHVDYINEDLEYYISSQDERMSYTLNELNESVLDLSGSFGDAEFTIVINDGYVTSFTDDNPAIWKRNFNMSLDWTFTAPDISGFMDYSN